MQPEVRILSDRRSGTDARPDTKVRSPLIDVSGGKSVPGLKASRRSAMRPPQPLRFGPGLAAIRRQLLVGVGEEARRARRSLRLQRDFVGKLDEYSDVGDDGQLSLQAASTTAHARVEAVGWAAAQRFEWAGSSSPAGY